MEKVKTFWNSLPKTAKVFCFIFISYTLDAIAKELGVYPDSALARYFVGLINIIIVLIGETVPAIKTRLLKNRR